MGLSVNKLPQAILKWTTRIQGLSSKVIPKTDENAFLTCADILGAYRSNQTCRRSTQREAGRAARIRAWLHTRRQHSSIGFPASESSSQASSQPIPQLRPFRRIPLPSLPSLPHRNSIASVSSFDSLSEDQRSRSGMAVSASNPGNIRQAKPIAANLSRTKPTFIESPKRRANKRSSSGKLTSYTRAQKRKQVVDEFVTTEKSYVDGLELIYSHFLTPIVTSLDTPKPLLDRASLTSVFSNFVDIWNLHRSFLSALTSHLGDESVSSPPSISSLLLSHFPYLSLYNPFITSFPSMVSTLTDMISPPTPYRPNPRYNQTFATFVTTQETDPSCGKLRLRDWLLTIVQRCPRYLLLLNDLIKYTDEDDPEYARLNTALALVKKITSSLDTALQNHAQILSLLALQKSTSGLPLQLIEPGRIFLKRGPLLQAERSSAPREREFLFFSDCLVWLADEEVERSWSLGWSTSVASDSNSSSPQTPVRHKLVRSRSKSEAELLKSKDDSEGASTSPQHRHSSVIPPPMKKPPRPPPTIPRRLASTGEEKWIFKGHASLIDVDVIVVPPREEGDERRFEVLSPEGSFVLYAGSESERESWVSEIRQAKAQLMASLNIINPNSTLTSSSSTNHLRRSLQALPFPPSDERIATIRAVQSSKDVLNVVADEESQKSKEKESSQPMERRRKFKTFFIADPSTNESSSKPARACEACYETVFPLVDPPTNGRPPSSPNTSSILSSSIGTTRLGNDTITSLSMLPSWVSMPTLPTQGSQPQALMVDLDISTDLDVPSVGGNLSTSAPSATGLEIEGGKRGRVKLRSASRPKSYHQILEDFQQEAEVTVGEGVDVTLLPSPPSMNWSSQPPIPVPSPRRRKEDTARRSKRFSLPAVALHTANVTARTMSTASGSSGSGSGGNGNSSVSSGTSGGTRGENVGGAMGRLRRLSLVPGARN
ncbi:FYVE, RhoGEF and PH domain-containing protein 6 [Leucoagaricus sp. SymC.cos]|nr:FYVE, RhoGEF and PH domain-containing protein 6 [Leucoagaricus sp. SymC.cos]